MRIVTVAAVHCAFHHLVAKRFCELRLCLGMAAHAKLCLAGFEHCGSRTVRFLFCGVEHSLGKINCGDLGTEACESEGVAACAAAYVGDFEIGDLAQEWESDAFFEDDEGVGFGVVDGGPAVVAIAGGEVLDLGSGHERKDRIGKEIEEANAKNTGRNAHSCRCFSFGLTPRP